MYVSVLPLNPKMSVVLFYLTPSLRMVFTKKRVCINFSSPKPPPPSPVLLPPPPHFSERGLVVEWPRRERVGTPHNYCSGIQ